MTLRLKVTGADDFEAAAQWAQGSQALGPNGGRTLSAILAEESESEEELRRKREKAEAEALEAMADDVLHRIWLKLNDRRIRAIDLFRKIDTSSDGTCSLQEFHDGLLWLGFESSERESQALVARLDKDGSGGVDLKEFDRAIKAVERKLVNQDDLAIVIAKRANAAAAALKGDCKAAATACPSCGSRSQENSDFCKKCGQKLPHSKTPRKLLGYTPVHAPSIEPMDHNDEFMLKIVGQMNARKYRSIDFFRTMDRDSSGSVTVDEFRVGLKKISLKPSKQEFDNLVEHLDKDGSGDIVGWEFDKAAKLVVKKARIEGRHGELETWGLSRGEELPSTFNWAHRSLRASAFAHSGALTERSPERFASASEGPKGNVFSCRIGKGSIYDSSIRRERMIDSASSGAHPTSTKMPKLPLHKTVYKKAYFDGRFGKEPSVVPHDSMLSNRDRCPTATRGQFVSLPRGAVRSFHNTPVMQSSVDQAVFNRDMDFSGDDKFDESFMALYEGCAGMASWHYGKS